MLAAWHARVPDSWSRDRWFESLPRLHCIRVNSLSLPSFRGRLMSSSRMYAFYGSTLWQRCDRGHYETEINAATSEIVCERIKSWTADFTILPIPLVQCKIVQQPRPFLARKHFSSIFCQLICCCLWNPTLSSRIKASATPTMCFCEVPRSKNSFSPRLLFRTNDNDNDHDNASVVFVTCVVYVCQFIMFYLFLLICNTNLKFFFRRCMQ